jgi:putative transposase
MAGATSPASGQRYGIARVCRVWQLPRSSFYAARRPRTDVAPAAMSPACVRKVLERRMDVA